MKSSTFQRMTWDGWPCVCLCVSRHVCILLFIAFLLCNMCFRGSFSGGASAKDKGHWGHREWFLCSSGFQIIQGWYKGAFCLSFSPFLSRLLSFLSVSYWIYLSATLCRLSRDSPDQIKHSFSAVCFRPETVSSDAPLFSASKAAAPTQKPHQATAALCLPPSVSLSPLWLCRCRQNTEVIIETSLKEQELDLLGLKAVLKR